MLASNCVKLTRCSRTIIYKKINLCKNIVPILSKDLSHVTNNLQKDYSTNKTTVKANIGHNKSQTVSTSILGKEQTKPRPKVSSEEVVEKLIAGLSSDIHQKNRVYKNDLLRIISKIKEVNFSSKKQSLLLLNCCTQLLADESPATRLELAKEIWDTVEPHTRFTVDHYNELLKVYIDNYKQLNVGSFIQQMSPIKPNVATYELILRALGEAGDINQATEVISNMKTQGIAANENVFNSLIICQGKAGSIDSVQEVLTMMKSLKLEYSVDTYMFTARAYAWNKKDNLMFDVMDKAVASNIQFGEIHIMEIVKTLTEVQNESAIPKVLQYLPPDILTTPSISPYMQSVATQLVFRNHPMAALEIYKCLPLPSFGPKDDRGLHGRSLVRDCVKASLPSSVIALIAQELMSSGRNPIAMQNACEAALQLGKSPLALDLFSRMKQMNMPLRPHYFWPILLRASATYGEKGITKTLSTMMSMEVRPDYETIAEYVLPHVSFTSPQNLMRKLLAVGLTVTNVLTPVMVALLNTGQVRAASEICELFEGKVDVEVLLRPLVRGYVASGDVTSTLHALQDVSRKAKDVGRDWLGRFMYELVRHKRTAHDLADLLALVKALEGKDLKISGTALDHCLARLPDKYEDDARNKFKDALMKITDERLVDESDMFAPQIPHPKQMDEESLPAHVRELEAKGLNTRGALRRLLQLYCREGNLPAANDILQKCRDEQIHLSAGMKASIFDLHVKSGELEQAELALVELTRSAPNFTLDEHKVIDFATLMVTRDQVDKACNLITEQSKSRRVVGGRGVSRNCWRLLQAAAARGRPAHVRRLLDLLTAARYCRPDNVLLGPLVRVHLNNGNLEAAVEEFVSLADKYRCTPLKHELACAVLRAGEGGEGGAGTDRLARALLAADRRVHGAAAAQLTLIGALAEVGDARSLRRLLLEAPQPPALARLCERLAADGRAQSLLTLAECARGLRHINVQNIYDLALDVYQRDDNVKEALELWQKMQEEEVSPSRQFVRNLCALCRANRRDVPAELAALHRQHGEAAA